MNYPLCNRWIDEVKGLRCVREEGHEGVCAGDTWLPVINPRRGGYNEDFDPKREYDFKRIGFEQVDRYRLADQSGWFNIVGLMFRAPPALPQSAR